MARSRIINGAAYFPDWRSGRPVANGTVYIGEVDLDPTILANRKTVYLIQEDGTEVPIAPAAQPLTLSAGGVVTYLGSPVQVQTDDAYSITVLDSLDVEVYYFNSVEDTLEILQPYIQSANFYTNDPSSASNAYVIVPPISPAPDVLVDGQICIFRPSNNSSGSCTISVMGDSGPIAPKQWLLPDGTNQLPAGYVRTTRDYMVRYKESIDSFIDIDMGLFSFNPSIQVWNQYIDYYTVPSYVTGSDDNLYKSTAQTGPNLGGAVDPVTDTGGDWVIVQQSINLNINELRLTLTTNVPITTTDVTGATTIYLTPYTGKNISLYDGVSWKVFETNEISLALGILTANIGYDVFVYPNSGVPTLEFLAWSSASARATALTTQDGILVKSGDPTRKYVGSFYTFNTTTTRDSKYTRYLFNYYNRAERSQGYFYEVNKQYNYTTATWRQWEAASSNKYEFFIGYADQTCMTALSAAFSNSSAGVNGFVGYGLNSITAPSGITAVASSANSSMRSMSLTDTIIPILGYNYVAGLEYSVASGTSTFVLGDGGAFRGGQSGSVMC